MGIPIRITADFSAETLQARREYQAIYKMKKGSNLEPRILHPARLSFRLIERSKAFRTSKN